MGNKQSSKTGISPLEVNRLLNQEIRLYEKRRGEYLARETIRTAQAITRAQVAEAALAELKQQAARNAPTAQKTHVTQSAQIVHKPQATNRTQTTTYGANAYSAQDEHLQGALNTQASDPLPVLRVSQEDTIAQNLWNAQIKQNNQNIPTQSTHVPSKPTQPSQCVQTIRNVPMTQNSTGEVPFTRSEQRRQIGYTNLSPTSVRPPRESQVNLEYNHTNLLRSKVSQNIRKTNNQNTEENTGPALQSARVTKAVLLNDTPGLTASAHSVIRPKISQDVRKTNDQKPAGESKTQAFIRNANTGPALKSARATKDATFREADSQDATSGNTASAHSAIRPKISQDVRKTNDQKPAGESKTQAFIRNANTGPALKSARATKDATFREADSQDATSGNTAAAHSAIRPKISQDVRKTNDQKSVGDVKLQEFIGSVNTGRTLQSAQATKPVTSREAHSVKPVDAETVPNFCSDLANGQMTRVFVNRNEQSARTRPPRSRRARSHSTNRQFNGTTSNNFKCVTCQLDIVPPVYECNRYHTSCSSCKDNSGSCGICGQTIIFIKSLSTEKNSTTKKKIPCPNAREGCKLVIKESELADHSKECPFQPLPCPAGCYSLLNLRQLHAHFDKFHVLQSSMKYGSELRLDISKDSHNVYPCLINGFHFVLFVKVSVPNKMIYMAVQLISTKYSASQWCYDIQVYDNNNIDRFVYTDICSSYFEPLIYVFKENKCFVMSHVYASNLATDDVLTYKMFIKKNITKIV